MNKIEKRLYKALRFLSSYPALDILDMMTDNKKRFEKYVPKDVNRTLQGDGYVIFQPGATNVVPMKGLQYLRILEVVGYEGSFLMKGFSKVNNLRRSMC